MALFAVATGVPVVIVVGAITGWSHSAMGMPTWASWTIAALAILIGLPLAWFSTPLGTRNATNILLRAYRRQGLEVAEQQYLSRLAPYRAGLQLFNLALALEGEGDQDGAEAVYRRAADCGFPPAMVSLAHRLSRRGEDGEARELFRRAAEAGGWSER
ncbi:hypothetical protein ACWCQN_19960 [Streptomyces sp. NPDC001984]|uniref:hypothetical protein n=1 Tax=Streptomyces sp. NPDC002619 TaxID=3364655 RepID=UPI0036D08F55